jgi:hypothetical protein
VPRIAFIVELFPPSIGGSERRYDISTEWLSVNGFQVDVHTTKHDPHLPEEEKRDGVTVLRHRVGKTYVRGAWRLRCRIARGMHIPGTR